MELRVESVQGSALPAGCFIGVRVGEVLKQGRYEPQRCYHFPNVDRRKNAKIDVYQHVGSCVVAVDPDVKSTHEVNVAATDPTIPSMRLKVNVHSNNDDVGKQQKETRTKQLKSQAKDYLSKHRIEERLSDAVKALLKEQPADPTEFLCRVLRGESGDELKSVQIAPPVKESAVPLVVDKPSLKPLDSTALAKQEPTPKSAPTTQAVLEPEKAVSPPSTQPQKSPTLEHAVDPPVGRPAKDLNTLRDQACEVLKQPCQDAEVGKVAQEAKTENCTPSRDEDKCATVSAPPERPIETKAKDATSATSASVTIVSAPPAPVVKASETVFVQAPMMLPTMTLMGAGFASSGMSPSLMFF